MSEQGTGPWATQRLVIRKGRASDAEEIWPWREDDELNRWLTAIPTSPEQNKERWVRSFSSRSRSPPWMTWTTAEVRLS